jgi:hypothetical protein
MPIVELKQKRKLTVEIISLISSLFKKPSLSISVNLNNNFTLSKILHLINIVKKQTIIYVSIEFLYFYEVFCLLK